MTQDWCCIITFIFEQKYSANSKIPLGDFIPIKIIRGPDGQTN
jgi:hypothetical protein